MSDERVATADKPSATEQSTRKTIPLRVDQTLLPPSDMPYGRMDLAFACSVGPNICLSFYQFDYQDAAATNIAANRSGEELEEIQARTILVSRVSMDADGFARLANEMKQIAARAGVPWP